MSDNCKNIEKDIKSFFYSYDRIIVLCFCLISFLLNLIILISIYVAKHKKISIVMRITGAILIVNFINILSYTFQWVLCKNKDETGDKTIYTIRLLFEKPKSINYVCNLQSFIMLSSALSQDYLVIFFFSIVNKKNLIKVTYINLFSILSVLIPIVISFLYLSLDGFGINDDFCYIKKYKYNDSDDNYTKFSKYDIFFAFTYTLRSVNFGMSIFLLIKLIKYVSKEKSFSYIINKLSMLFIQLFKLFVILFYRISNYFWKDYPKILRKIYVILSTIDGLLLPLAFAYSNQIYHNFFKSDKKTRKDSEVDKDLEEDITNINNDNPTRDEEISMAKNNIYSNSINFDLSY